MQVTVRDPSEDFLKNEVKEFKPHKRQEDFLAIPDTVFEALYGGGAYGGKSILLTLMFIIRGFYKYRGAKGILFRREMTDLEKENIRLTQEYFPLTGGKYNENKKSWHWPEYGSYFDFGHIQHMKDIKSYDTLQYNLAIFEELTHFEEAMYLYIVGSRVRPSGSFHIAIARSGSNPGGVGQTFVYNRFVKHGEQGYKLIKDKKTHLRRMFIPALYQDNPFGMQYDPDYGNKLEILPEAEKRAKKYGDWHAFKGSVFTSFRPIRFPTEPENALHVIEPFDIPKHWPRIISIDWGKRAMTHCMWAAISPNRRLYIYREKWWKDLDVPFWASEIREINEEFNENITHTVLCGSAWQSRGSETVADQFQEYSKLSASSSENYSGSRIAGLQLVHDFLRWEKRPTLRSKEEFYDIQKSQNIYRLYGPEAQERYKQQFYDEVEEDNLPRLQIFNTCQMLIDTIPMAIYDETKIEDIAEFDGDDPIDNLRYLCKAAKRFLAGEIGNQELDERREQIITQFNETQDMTALYRQMERLEALMRHNVSQGIAISRRSRFSRGRHR